MNNERKIGIIAQKMGWQRQATQAGFPVKQWRMIAPNSITTFCGSY